MGLKQNPIRAANVTGKIFSFPAFGSTHGSACRSLGRATVRLAKYILVFGIFILVFWYFIILVFRLYFVWLIFWYFDILVFWYLDIVFFGILVFWYFGILVQHLIVPVSLS